MMLVTSWCWWHFDVDDSKSVTENRSLWHLNGDMIWMLVTDANVKIKWLLVTRMIETVTNIFKLSPTNFVSNIRCPHRCNLMNLTLHSYLSQLCKSQWSVIVTLVKCYKSPFLSRDIFLSQQNPRNRDIFKNWTTKFDKSAQNQFETSDLRCLLWNKLEKIKLDSQVNVDLRISKIIKLHKSSRSSRFSRSWIWSVVSKSSDHHFELVNGLVRTKFDEKKTFLENLVLLQLSLRQLYVSDIKWWLYQSGDTTSSNCHHWTWRIGHQHRTSQRNYWILYNFICKTKRKQKRDAEVRIVSFKSRNILVHHLDNIWYYDNRNRIILVKI